MKEQKKIIEEIEAVGLKAEAQLGGFHVCPNDDDDSCIWRDKLDKLIAIAHKYRLSYYINFEMGFVRLH